MNLKKLLCSFLAIAMILSTMGTVAFAEETPDKVISSLADLQQFAAEVNAGDDYSGKIVVLDTYIDLTDVDWTPIGNGERTDSNSIYFSGVFNGCGNTINGLSIEENIADNNDKTFGLFGVVKGGTVKNINFTNVGIQVNATNVGAAVGYADGATITDIVVGAEENDTSSVKAYDGAGGVAGRIVGIGIIENCVNYADVEVTSNGGAGGIVGKAYKPDDDKSLYVKNCKNYGSISSPYSAGGIAGLSGTNVLNCENHGAISGAVDAGGIVSWQNITVNGSYEISGNTNTGTITVTNPNQFGAGGIVGRAQGAISISINNNTNRGDVVVEGTTASGASSWTDAGGIIGYIFDIDSTITGNENTAKTIKASEGGFAGGIAGLIDNHVDDLNVTVKNNISTTAGLSVAGSCENTTGEYDETPLPANVAKNQTTGKKYTTLAEALDAAKDGDTIELIADPNTAIDAKGVVAGNKTVTITGTAKFNWAAGWLFVGRGAEGDGKLIFEDATITSDEASLKNGTYGIQISDARINDDTVNHGSVEFINSDIQLSYFYNRNEVIVDDSKLYIEYGFCSSGRAAHETGEVEDGVASLTVKNGAEVVLNKENSMGFSYEGSGVLNIENGSFVFNDASDKELIGTKGKVNISGDVTIRIPDGTVNATGDVNFKGENNVNILPINTYTYTIGKDASLAIEGRITLGHGATVNVIGNIEDAKEFDTTTAKPSLLIKTASITGKGLDFNAENAYIAFGPHNTATTSKNNAAYDTFDFDFDNCVVDFNSKFMFSIPTEGKEPTFNFNFTDGVLTAEKFLQFTAEGCNTVIDNSIVKLKDQFENGGNLTLQNNSKLTGSIVATSQNANQFGTLTVDNSTFEATGTFYGRLLNDNNPMTGELILKNGANATINGHIKDVFVTVDTSSTLKTGSITGESTVTIDTSNITLGKNTVLDLSESESRKGKVTISPELTASGQEVIYGPDGDITVDMYVAKIGDKTYSTLKEALADIKDTDGTTIKLYGTIEEEHLKLPTPFKNLTIDGKPEDSQSKAVVKNTIITDTQGNNFVYDGLTIKNTIFDNSNFNLAGRNAGNVYGDLVFDNNEFINFYNTSSLAPVHMNLGEASTFKSFTFKNNLVENVSGSSNNGVAIKQVEGKTTIENNVFKNIPNNAVQVFYSNGIDLTKNTISEIGGSLINLNGTTGNISLAENTMTKSNDSQKFIGYLAEGKGVSLSNNKWYDTQGNQLSAFGDFKAEYNGLYYMTLEEAAAVAGAGKTINLPDGRKYLVPAAKPEGKLAITFDFSGGHNAGGYVAETAYYNMNDSVNAPIAYRDGFIFLGWDADDDGDVDEVMEKAMSPATYKAIWYDKEKYGYKVTLTPTGGTMLGERDMKVNPSDYFIVNVSVSDLFDTGLAWNDALITLTYDTNVFKYVYGDGVTETTPGKLYFTMYGDDRANGSLAKQISFQALNPGSDANINKYGDFKVTNATVDAAWAANRIDATPTSDDDNASVYIYYSYDVTLGEGLTGSAVATTDADYVGEIKNYDDNYNYKVWVEREDGKRFEADLDGKNFTVNKEDITGNLKIELQLIGLKDVDADDIEIYEYVAGKVALVLLNAAEDAERQYTYNNAIMYETPWYMTTASTTNKLYGYLVAKENFTEVGGTLNHDDNKKVALSKIGIATDGRTNPEITNDPGDVNAANRNMVIDINDVQAVWNCYNGNDGEAINVNMPLYLRADICGESGAARDKKIDASDVNAVMQMVDLAKQGYVRDYKAAALATCGSDGSTYALSYTKGTKEVEVVKAETVSAANDPTAGHNFKELLDGDGLNIKYVIKCTNCDCVKETYVASEMFPNLTLTAANQLIGEAQISTREQLIFLNALGKANKLACSEDQSLCYKLLDDIDLAGYEWYPLSGGYGAHKPTVFDGNGHTIKNLSAVQGVSGKSGLFGYAMASIIKNLTLENVTARGCQVGAFAGQIEGAKIENCTIKGNINITWEQNSTSSHVETWGGAGAIIGIANHGSCSATDAGATITITNDNMTSQATAADTEMITYIYSVLDNDYSDFIITK